jgi:1-deoxy-D-xylulose-5-phosphate synthase
MAETLTKLAADDHRIVGVTAAMAEGTGMDIFREKFPHRFYDAGMAEQHAVTFAAGLATQGFRPVVAIYSTFLQRAFDQIVHDVCLMNLPVTFVLDRGGMVGEDGPTHHGIFDLSFLRTFPNMIVTAPIDESELPSMLRTAIEHPGPAAIRYPRGRGLGQKINPHMELMPIGKGELLRSGKDLVVLAVGGTVHPSLEAARMLEGEGIDAAVVNMRFVKPLDEELLKSLAHEFSKFVTVEDNVLKGGFGSAVAEFFTDNNMIGIQLKRVGLPDSIIEHGSLSILRARYGLDARGIAEAAKEVVSADNVLNHKRLQKI